jgi:hypothetical protein
MNLSDNNYFRKSGFIGFAFSIHDLKCGNILNYDTAEGEILTTVIDWQDLKWLSEDPKGFNLVHSPLKINIDVLRKIGFKKDSKYDWIIEPSWGDVDNGVGCFMFTCGHEVGFQYVHELQNFYYCLTGEMLSF